MRPPARLIDRGRSVLVIVDLQERLVPAMAEQEAVVGRARVLLEASRVLAVPVLATEHCPDRIGPTVAALRQQLDAGEIVAKRTFAATGTGAFVEAVAATGRELVVMAGTEAHVCVLQTAFGLLEAGFAVAVVADAVASRRTADRDAGLARMAAAGVIVATTEMVLFEWLGHADVPEFRSVHRLIR